VMADHPNPVSVVELGAGNGSDAVALAEAGHAVQAFDYARGAFRAARAAKRDHSWSLMLGQVNLYDLRDALTMASLQRARQKPPQVLMARFLLDHLQPRAWPTFWRVAQLLLRSGGRAYLEFDEPEGVHESGARLDGRGLPQFAVHLDDVRRQLERRGAKVVLAEAGGRTAATDGEPARVRHQVVAEWL
jgi:hypothetical protein